MTRPNIHAIIVIISFVGVLGLLTEHQWRPALAELLAPETPPVRVVTFSEAMQCPPWKPGSSRVLAVLVTEDEHGRVLERQCVRTQERKWRVM